jgi:serine/threonine protein kinase/Tfp pilus assembly protein PilF
MEATGRGEKGPQVVPAGADHCWSVEPDTKDPVIPERVSHYSILDRLGAGGMGEVYLAEDTVLNRRVAIKFLPNDSLADPQANRRLIREAQAAAKLDHPNICTIHEVGEEADRCFIVMEYVEGETLASRIRNKRLDLNECLEIAVQVADALAAAHSQGITHRDIKPQNIMLTSHHQVKVIDFGLAKVIRDKSLVDSEAVTESLITSGAIVGTITYMSPEQVRGESLDARSDIFSFGAVLYEMVTGDQLFAAGSAAMTITAVVSRKPPALTQYSSNVPDELERIVSKALQKEREERYQTIRELLNDLRSLKHHLEFEEELKRSGAPLADAKTKRLSEFTSPRTESKLEYLVNRIKHHRRNLIIGLSAFVLAVVVAAYFFYLPNTPKAIDSIAVLPLTNVSGDSSADYLSDGISEALINSLTELQQLRVIARTTAFRYKGKDVDPLAVGRELKVRAVLMGRMRQIGDTLNIQVDLVDAATGAQLWGKEYERKVSDILSVKRLIARDVTGKLRLGLSGQQQQKLSKGDTANPEAYEFYLRGCYFRNRRTADDLRKAIEQFQQAIDLDPNYALAYVGMSDSYVLLEQYAGTPSSETLPKARAAIERALEIDDSLAEAHTSLARIEGQSWNNDEAEREYKRAIVLNPNYATAHHWYGMFLRNRGRFDEAMPEIKLAKELDPLSPGIGAALAGTLYMKGEQDAAIEEAKKVIELDPKQPIAHWTLGIFYRLQGRYGEAIAEEVKAVELSGRASLYLSELGVCYAAAGNRAGALELLKEVEEKYNRREAVGLYVADVYAELGNKDQAFAWLEKDFQAHDGQLPQIAHNPPKGLRDDPRFQDLLRRIGLPQN